MRLCICFSSLFYPCLKIVVYHHIPDFSVFIALSLTPILWTVKVNPIQYIVEIAEVAYSFPQGLHHLFGLRGVSDFLWGSVCLCGVGNGRLMCAVFQLLPNHIKMGPGPGTYPYQEIKSPRPCQLYHFVREYLSLLRAQWGFLHSSVALWHTPRVQYFRLHRGGVNILLLQHKRGAHRSIALSQLSGAPSSHEGLTQTIGADRSQSLQLG